MARPRLLILAYCFAPGYRAGGPVRSAVNVALTMARTHDVYVLTADTDVELTGPYDNVESDRWVDFAENVRVCYLSKPRRNYSEMVRRIREVAADCAYLNGMFSLPFTILPLVARRLGAISVPMVLAPRGMLRGSALAFKPAKKRLFLGLFRSLRIQKLVTFQATDDTEAADIRSAMGRSARSVTLPNPPPVDQPAWKAFPKNGDAPLEIVQIARIHPIKNIEYLIDLLGRVQAPVHVRLAGPLDDPPYWEHCLEKVGKLPAHVQVEYLGELPYPKIRPLVTRHHLFILPTLGENFGHAIFEALSIGRPVVISDQTPWRDLTVREAGWDLPLDDPSRFVGAIEKVAAMDQEEYDRWSRAGWELARRFIEEGNWPDRYATLFEGAVASSTGK